MKQEYPSEVLELWGLYLKIYVQVLKERNSYAKEGPETGL